MSPQRFYNLGIGTKSDNQFAKPWPRACQITDNVLSLEICELEPGGVVLDYILNDNLKKGECHNPCTDILSGISLVDLHARFPTTRKLSIPTMFKVSGIFNS